MVVTVVTAHGSGGSGGWGGSGEYGNSPIGKNGGSPTLERADHFAKGGSGEAKGRGVASEPKMADVGDLDTFGMVWGELLSVQQTARDRCSERIAESRVRELCRRHQRERRRKRAAHRGRLHEHAAR